MTRRSSVTPGVGRAPRRARRRTALKTLARCSCLAGAGPALGVPVSCELSRPGSASIPPAAPSQGGDRPSGADIYNRSSRPHRPASGCHAKVRHASVAYLFGPRHTRTSGSTDDGGIAICDSDNDDMQAPVRARRRADRLLEACRRGHLRAMNQPLRPPQTFCR